MIPPYLDPKHPNFSTELYICVMFWMDLFSDPNKELPDISVVEMLKKWLKEKRIEVEEETIEEMSLTIEPEQMKLSEIGI